MRRPRRAWPLAAAALAALAACSGPEPRPEPTPEARLEERPEPTHAPPSPAARASALPDRLGAGTITYYAPAGRRGTKTGQQVANPVRLALTSRKPGASPKADNEDRLVLKGEVNEHLGRPGPTGGEVARELLSQASRQEKRVSSRRLEQIWQSLIAAGIDTLPRQGRGKDSGDPPEDRAWILLESDAGDFLFENPLGRASAGARPDRKPADSWQRCVAILIEVY